ncbi:MAG: cytidylate kinase-like family protein [Clostridia bacterium]|nr:cytidylate kinase-like family protein [Clostridia bacterium]MBR1684005.1 cytidylate kinase-like family protein [Clostridia bacterium]MBR2287262.1 cytidylate kinase-like family protein [Clostridia bacterium]
MAKTNMVITIGRQYGSGGREVGRRLARCLEIPYYDKELLAEASKDSGICEELFEDHDEKPTRSFLYSLVTGVQTHGTPSTMYMDMPLNHRIFLAQFDTIRRLAGQGPCVVVGRCADYVLRDDKNVVNVFLKADMEHRKERAIERGADIARAEEVVKRHDKERAAYYNYYATTNWGDVNNYDLCLDTGRIGYDGAVEMICEYVQRREALLGGK